jgi:hypothetical protein
MATMTVNVISTTLLLVAHVAILGSTSAAEEELQESVHLATPVDTCRWAQQVVAGRVGSDDRHIAGYDRYGHFCVRLSDTNRRDIESGARGFLWSHWLAQERGVVMLTRHTREGEPSTSLMYVEPSEDGGWHLRVVIERLLSPRGGGAKSAPSGQFFHKRYTYIATAIQRIEIPHDGFTPRRFIDDAAVRDPNTYRLSIRTDDETHVVEF